MSSLSDSTTTSGSAATTPTESTEVSQSLQESDEVTTSGSAYSSDVVVFLKRGQDDPDAVARRFYRRGAKVQHQFNEFVDLTRSLVEGDAFGRAYLSVGAPRARTVSVSQDVLRGSRYCDILPVEVTRVRLPSGFIHANNIVMATDQKYIAAQGPLTNTIGPFWEMVLQEKVTVIVMLGTLLEDSVEKCAAYWPKRRKKILFAGTVAVRLDGEHHPTGDTVIRQFTIRGEDRVRRKVIQVQYTAWPDHGVPDRTSFGVFMASVEELCKASVGTMLVHCSAGVGRTGVFVVLHSILDAMRQYLEGGNVDGSCIFDVGGATFLLRSQRSEFMVQTEEQFEFIFLFLAEFVAARLVLYKDAFDRDQTLEIEPPSSG